jgi:thymidylate synthase (FAD)
MSALELNEKYTNKDEVYSDKHMIRASKYLVWTNELFVDFSSVVALENLRLSLTFNISNDKAKFCLPESYKTELTWTINARSLQNFISLRSSNAALWEIRQLASSLFDTLPKDHQYLFQDCIAQS